MLTTVLAINFVVAVGKVVAGQITGTVSVMAEGFESLMDIPSELLGVFALGITGRPADLEHPYGHRKAETLATFLIAALMFLTVGKVIYDASLSLRGHIQPNVSWLALGMMVTSIVTKAGLSFWEQGAGRRLKSDFLMADAAQLRVDIYRNAAVIAGLGLAFMGWKWADPILGLLIAGLILVTGVRILRRGTGVLMDTVAIDPRLIERIALSVPGVRECHGVRSRGHADHVYADLHVLVDPQLSVEAGHEISEKVVSEVRKALPDVADVVVHLEPYNDIELDEPRRWSSDIGRH